MDDDDRDPNMYPRWMETVGRVIFTVLVILAFAVQIFMLVPSPHR
ncbi:hypothetical protein ACFQZO_30730 [Bradyrhizobium sp. GCM10027634]|nr:MULTISPECIES: hypothetical protein [unclassified Bradyrhizobium]MDN5005236.1 hypothetical protein [Bradyrhizobium sp. WYCCWR 12677]